MTTSRRLAALPLLLIGLAALCAALALIPWVVQAQSQEVTPTASATGANPPAKPTNLQASAEHDSVTLTWTASTDQTVTHYAILRRNPDTDASQVFHVIESNAGAETSYTDSSVSASSTYIYRVKSVSPTGVSQWSGYVKAETPAAPTPTPTPTPEPTPTPSPEPVSTPDPADLRPTGLTVSLVENKVTLSWAAPTEDAASVDGYEILRRRPSEGEGALMTLVADTESTATTYTDATANEAGVVYVYRVKALRGSEVSRWSNFARIELSADYVPDPTPTPEPESTPVDLAPSNLTALITVALEDSTPSVFLSWTAPAEDADSVTGYEVQRATCGGGFTALAADTGSTATAYTDATATEAGETYAYRVRARRPQGLSLTSNTSTVILPGGTGDGACAIADGASGTEAVVEEDPIYELSTHNTPRILVSNVGQASDDSASLSGNDHAQLFHTAGATNGYVLTSLIVVSEDAEGDDFQCQDLRGGRHDRVSNLDLHGLRDPDNFAAGSLEFTHPGMYLNRNDNYLAVFEQKDTGSVTLDSTTSGGQDSGGLSGWSIKDKFDWKSGSTWQQKGGGDEAIRITVKGYEAAANEDATGRPTILASAEGAPILFADTLDIADGNGISFTGSVGSNIEFVYSYQWIRVDGGTAAETQIGDDSPSYLLVDADIGNKIKVEVSFTDQGEAPGDCDQPAVRPGRPTGRPVGGRNDAGQQHGPVGVGHGEHHRAVFNGIHVGRSRPGLRNLQRLDRTGGGPVRSDRLAVDRRPFQ